MYIDGCQYCSWSRSVFEQMKQGKVTAVVVTVAYHEDFRDTVDRLVEWNWRFRHFGDLIMPGRTARDIDEAVRTGRTAIFFGLQNPSPIDTDAGLVQVLYDLGVRFMQLSYNIQSLLCAGWTETEDRGLTLMGREIIGEMNRVGMVVDMSHSAERSTLEAIDYSSRPIAVTHANPQSWRMTKRNKSDLVLKKLAERGGMVGLSLYPYHMRDDSETTLEEFCAMTARLAEMIGARHIGIGSDLNQDHSGGVLRWMREGRWHPPAPPSEAEKLEFPPPVSFFKSNRDFGKIEQGLRATGFSAEEAAGIVGGNWARFFAEAFEPQPSLQRRSVGQDMPRLGARVKA